MQIRGTFITGAIPRYSSNCSKLCIYTGYSSNCSKFFIYSTRLQPEQYQGIPRTAQNYSYIVHVYNRSTTKIFLELLEIMHIYRVFLELLEFFHIQDTFTTGEMPRYSSNCSKLCIYTVHVWLNYFGKPEQYQCIPRTARSYAYIHVWHNYLINRSNTKVFLELLESMHIYRTRLA